MQEFLQSPIPMLIAIFAIMYFLLLRPQPRRAKQHKALVDNVRRGDTVVTAGGVIGLVVKVPQKDDPEITVDAAWSLPAQVRRAGSIAEVLKNADFVSLHVPLLPSTRHLMSTPQFARMKRSAFLINTSRGPVVDEAALVTALDAGRIAGAALDVFENEPKVHPGLLGRKNAVLTPHIASASLETRTKMAMIATENAIALFDGRRPPNALNPEALEKSRG